MAMTLGRWKKGIDVGETKHGKSRNIKKPWVFAPHFKELSVKFHSVLGRGETS
jgi:hypothetical protein